VATAIQIAPPAIASNLRMTFLPDLKSPVPLLEHQPCQSAGMGDFRHVPGHAGLAACP
jgi:hypothetical protein